MTQEKTQQFKQLFSEYCREEINKGHCCDDSCEMCPINAAWDEIFNKFADDDENEEDE